MRHRTFAPRCATKGIHDVLPQSMKLKLFEYVDRQVSSGLDMDYLQIFEFSTKVINSKYHQCIVHRQEVPLRSVEYTICDTDAPLDLTVWIVDEETHATMLLPEEY
ncbi:DUF960 family protein [Paenibacillus sp. GCM10012307]|uniref:DUF960 domain-containing protein n=1 Tax=Paenibacillus roseus TaxID=2798579 RepID=A0A934J5R3_9BACL|nr:DUF960 family protein [Paenibacillus roseus]MBJ6360905.1 hypothetical protein [Paenibacillus roseus]